MDRERVAPPAFDRDGSPKERADLGGQDIESAAHEREAGEAGLEHRALTLELTATVHEEADERALQDARIGARQAERRDPQVGRRRAQLVQRRVGGGRVGLRALARPRCPPGSSRTPETRARARFVVSSRRSVAVGATTSRAAAGTTTTSPDSRTSRAGTRARSTRTQATESRAAPRAARRPGSRRAGGRPAARRWSSSRRSVGRQAGGALPDTVRASVAGSPGWRAAAGRDRRAAARTRRSTST